MQKDTKLNILVIFTSYNRKQKTEECIRSLSSGNSTCNFSFIVVDDNSSDGTVEILNELKHEYDIHVINGNGKLFYSGGMRAGMDYALASGFNNYDYLFICNDDVKFYTNCLEKMINQSLEQNNAVIVGAMQDSLGNQSYGAVKYTKGIKYKKTNITEWTVDCDTFNANGVLIPYIAFKRTGSFDNHYIHSLGDFDYGISLTRNGFKIHSSKEFVGLCENNSLKGQWNDNSLPIHIRFKKKEDIKGAPIKQWFYFLNKNFSLITAIQYSISPYIRILLGR